MRSKRCKEGILQVKHMTDAELQVIPDNLINFGYRERLLFERPLFLLLKLISDSELNYNLKGFSKDNIDELITHAGEDRPLQTIITKIWELKVFIKSLSSSSAYIRGDTLSIVNVNEKDTVRYIKKEINNIFRKVEQLFN